MLFLATIACWQCSKNQLDPSVALALGGMQISEHCY